MANYISSNANRFYVAVEGSYGQAATLGTSNRFPAVRLEAQQVLQPGRRLDKTGSRSFRGISKDSRRHTAFQVRTYLTSWSGSGEPSYGPLFQASLGAAAKLSSGLIVASASTASEMETTAPHGLGFGSAVSYAGEIRFVASVPSATAIVTNAPFSNMPAVNAALAPAITYTLSTALPSVTLYDYWDPPTAISRVITGAAVDSCELSVNGDYHEFLFSGPAADLLDSSSFASGSAGLSTFPAEPSSTSFDYSIVPGHLGQVWLGSTEERFFTLTRASVNLKNNVALRDHEFGSSYARAIAPGSRHVGSSFTLFAQDDSQTAALYLAAKQRHVISAMLQLGQQQGQVMGIFLPGVIPEIPNYDDSETRLLWQFKNNVAQGNSDDELYIAFA